MLLECQLSKHLWECVENWIREIGVLQYAITEKTNILGELNKAYWLNIVILNTHFKPASSEDIYETKL